MMWKISDGILKVSKDNSVDLAENEFYYHEIIGLHVLEDGTELGKVKKSCHQVPMMFGRSTSEKLIYCFPYIASVVKEVDLEAGGP